MTLLTNLGSVWEEGGKASAIFKKENISVNTYITSFISTSLHL